MCTLIIQQPEVPRHLGWPSLLGDRNRCWSCCEERVSPSPHSLDRSSGLLTTGPRSLHTRGGVKAGPPADGSNRSLSLSLPLSLPTTSVSLSPLLLGPLPVAPGPVTTGSLPALWARTKENGSDRDPMHPDHLSKRPCTLSPAQRFSPSNGLPHPTLAGLRWEAAEEEPSFLNIHLGGRQLDMPTLRAQEGPSLPRDRVVDVPGPGASGWTEAGMGRYGVWGT